MWNVFIAVVPRCHAFLLTVLLEGESDEVYSRGKGPGSHCAASEGHSWSSADRATSQVSDATYSHMFSHLYSFMYTILGMLLDISSCFFFLLSLFYHGFIMVLSLFYHGFITVSYSFLLIYPAKYFRIILHVQSFCVTNPSTLS